MALGNYQKLLKGREKLEWATRTLRLCSYPKAGKRMQQINRVAGFEALLCCQQTFQLNTQKLNECKEVTKLGPESSGSSVTQSLVSKVGSTNRTQQLQREWGRFILLVQNKHGIFYYLHLQGQRNKREHIFILSFCVPIWYKYSI